MLQLQESNLDEDQAAVVASYVADELEVMSATLARLNRKLAVEEATQRIQDKELRVLAKEQNGSENLDKIKLLCKQKQVVRELRRLILPLRSDIKFYQQQRYTLRKFLEGFSPSADTKAKHRAKSTKDTNEIKMTEPTLYRPGNQQKPRRVSRPGCMDYVETVSINKLLAEIELHNSNPSNRHMELVPGGTDPGAITLFETVAVSADMLITLRNRFGILSSHNEEDISVMDKDFNETLALSRATALKKIKIPDAHKTTVARIRHDSGLTNQQQHRNRRLKDRKFKKVQQWYDDLAKDSIHRADSINDVEQAAGKRRQAAAVLQEFEQSGSTRNKHHHTQMRLRRAYDHAAKREREIFQHAGKLYFIYL